MTDDYLKGVKKLVFFIVQSILNPSLFYLIMVLFTRAEHQEFAEYFTDATGEFPFHMEGDEPVRVNLKAYVPLALSFYTALLLVNFLLIKIIKWRVNFVLFLGKRLNVQCAIAGLIGFVNLMPWIYGAEKKIFGMPYQVMIFVAFAAQISFFLEQTMWLLKVKNYTEDIVRLKGFRNKGG